MNTIVILSDHVSPLNVLASKLRIKRYTDIRLKGEKYGDILSRFLTSLKKKQSILIYNKADGIPRVKDLASFIKSSGVTVTPQTRVLFLNLAYYITDLKTVDTIIQKMIMVDEPVFGTLNQSPIGWFCVPFSMISSQGTNPSALVPATVDHSISFDKYLINLQDPKVVLDLFAASFDTRHFNKIKHDDVFFIKTSDHLEKLESEHRFLAEVPTSLKPFFPHVGEFGVQSQIAKYQVERIFAFNVSTLLMHNTITPEVFSKLLMGLNSYFDRCEKLTNDASKTDTVYHEYFVNKLKSRFEAFKALACFEKVNAYWSLYSGKSCDVYFEEFISELEKALPKMDGKSLAFSHGDLCFSNILFDVETGAIKLIDPRGKKTDDDVFLPYHYDFAKLSHSLLGGYDYILSGHEAIKVSKSLSLQQEFHGITPYDDHLKMMFIKWMSSKCNIADVRLCEASLFFSMSVLHHNNPHHVLSQWMSGDKAFKFYLENR